MLAKVSVSSSRESIISLYPRIDAALKKKNLDGGADGKVLVAGSL